jgi:hypothetical protein
MTASMQAAIPTRPRCRTPSLALGPIMTPRSPTLLSWALSVQSLRHLAAAAQDSLSTRQTPSRGFWLDRAHPNPVRTSNFAEPRPREYHAHCITVQKTPLPPMFPAVEETAMFPAISGPTIAHLSCCCRRRKTNLRTHRLKITSSSLVREHRCIHDPGAGRRPAARYIAPPCSALRLSLGTSGRRG